LRSLKNDIRASIEYAIKPDSFIADLN